MKCIVAIANCHVIVNRRGMVSAFRLSALLSLFPSIFCFDVSAVRRASARNGAEEATHCHCGLQLRLHGCCCCCFGFRSVGVSFILFRGSLGSPESEFFFDSEFVVIDYFKINSSFVRV